MKKLLYILLLPLLILSCVKEQNMSVPGDEAVVRFSLDQSDFSSLRSRSYEDLIQTLELWVFDEQGLFVEKAKEVQYNPFANSFTAKVSKSMSPRIIHFIVNYTLANEANWVGHDEKEMVPSLSVGTQPTYLHMWARKRYEKIEGNDNLQTITVRRNMAKFSLAMNTAKLTEVEYSLYNTFDKGTLAPFDPSETNPDLAFKKDFVTEPAGADFDNQKGFKPVGPENFFYGFERKNSVIVAGEQISCLIIKGKYQGSNAFSYYKIDFVHQDDKTKRYDIIRNHFYKVTINDVFKAGFPTIEAALSGAAANNIALSEELQMYPSFSDGKGKIEVDHTYLAFTDGQTTGTIKAAYYPNVGNVTQQNNLITVTYSGDAVTGATNNNGTISLSLAATPSSGSCTSDIIVGAQDNPDLKRLVRVVVRKPYVYNPFAVRTQKGAGDAFTEYTATSNAVSCQVHKTQDKALNIVMNIPADFNPALLPTTFRIKTNNFYPSGGQGLIFGNEAEKPFYDYILTAIPTDRKVELMFKSNKSASAETITVSSRSKYFHTQRITVANP